jgi:hypothetical protein
VKKAEMSINLIIAIVIALLILVILAFLVTDKFHLFNNATKCGGIGQGICSDDCKTLEGEYAPLQTNDGQDNGCKSAEVCCIPISKTKVQ